MDVVNLWSGLGEASTALLKINKNGTITRSPCRRVQHNIDELKVGVEADRRRVYVCKR